MYDKYENLLRDINDVPSPVSRSFAIIYLVARLLFEFLIFILELLIGLYANRKANLLVQQLSEHQRKRAIGEV